MNILIIEDEAAATRRLKKLIGEIMKDAQIIAVIESVSLAVNWLKNNPMPDLIFMDIQLADGVCFDVLKKVNITAPVIFTTAYDEFAIRAFEVNAIAYLLKPLKQNELELAITKFKRTHTAAVPDYRKLLETMHREDSYQKRVLIKIGQTVRAIEFNEVAYFHMEDKIVTLVTFENKKYPVDYNLDELERILDPKKFYRINRQFIVHSKAIVEMHVVSKSRVKLNLQPSTNWETIVSTERSAKFKKWLTDGEQ